jgi:hypothetical protein
VVMTKMKAHPCSGWITLHLCRRWISALMAMHPISVFPFLIDCGRSDFCQVVCFFVLV